jgi:cardiolipin synthase C
VGFVGSFNFDLRSAFLNAEMGVVFDDPRLLADLAQSLSQLTAPEISWRLALESGRLTWRKGDRTLYHDPDAPALRRGLSWIVGHLPIHSYL